MSSYTAARDGKEGAWIGIDLGTSNCACAIWDSTRGRPKLLQLDEIARPRKGKVGRIVPSSVLLGTGDIQVADIGRATVGIAALQRLERGDDVAVVNACVTSVKRLVGATNLRDDAEFLKSLPFELFEEDDNSLSLSVVPLGSTKPIRVTPLEILKAILMSIRLASDHYLAKYTRKKNLKVPGSSTFVTNCVVGVPAHFGRRQRQNHRTGMSVGRICRSCFNSYGIHGRQYGIWALCQCPHREAHIGLRYGRRYHGRNDCEN